MTIFHTAVMVIIALDSIYLLSMCVSDICYKIKRYWRKKAGKQDDELAFLEDGEDFEPFLPELGTDALIKLKPDRISLFVEDKMFPAAPRTLAHLTCDEKYQAQYLLTAYIGMLMDTAPDCEKDFTVLLELLENAVPERDGSKPVSELLIEEQKYMSGVTRFYASYLRFQKWCKDKPLITRACLEIVRTIVVKVYGYIPADVSGLSVMDAETFVDEKETE